MIQIDNIKNELFRDYCLGIICNHIGLDPEVVLFKRGKKRIFLEPKQVLQYALKTNTNLSWQDIADLTGKKSHATIMSNCRTIENLLETSKEFRERYERPLEMIRVKATKRCMIVSEREIDKGRLRKVNDDLIKMGKFPVFITGARRRFSELLDCGSICLVPGYENSADAILEFQVAKRLGLEILYADKLDKIPIMRLNLK